MASLNRLRKNAVSSRFREGHDFSRAAKSFGFARASAPEVSCSHSRLLFPQPLKRCPDTDLFSNCTITGALKLILFRLSFKIGLSVTSDSMQAVVDARAGKSEGSHPSSRTLPILRANEVVAASPIYNRHRTPVPTPPQAKQLSTLTRPPFSDNRRSTTCTSRCRAIFVKLLFAASAAEFGAAGSTGRNIYVGAGILYFETRRMHCASP